MIPWWQFRRRARCPHVNVKGIYGDEIIRMGWARLFCADCGRTLDGPVSIAEDRRMLPKYKLVYNMLKSGGESDDR